MKTKKSKVTHVSISRLYNMGSYEHVKYDLGVEVPDGASANEAFMGIARILFALKPIKFPYNFESMKDLLAKPMEELSESEKSIRPEYAERVGEIERLRAARVEALKQLDDLGGTGQHKDAKLSWGDDEDLF